MIQEHADNLPTDPGYVGPEYELRGEERVRRERPEQPKAEKPSATNPMGGKTDKQFKHYEGVKGTPYPAKDMKAVSEANKKASEDYIAAQEMGGYPVDPYRFVPLGDERVVDKTTETQVSGDTLKAAEAARNASERHEGDITTAPEGLTGQEKINWYKE